MLDTSHRTRASCESKCVPKDAHAREGIMAQKYAAGVVALVLLLAIVVVPICASDGPVARCPIRRRSNECMQDNSRRRLDSVQCPVSRSVEILVVAVVAPFEAVRLQ
eukprot:Polyplicarium_translucidae@DN2685_c0_g1_i1.p3